jgi:hypothetical protein
VYICSMRDCVNNNIGLVQSGQQSHHIQLNLFSPWYSCKHCSSVGKQHSLTHSLTHSDISIKLHISLFTIYIYKLILQMSVCDMKIFLYKLWFFAWMKNILKMQRVVVTFELLVIWYICSMIWTHFVKIEWSDWLKLW